MSTSPIKGSDAVTCRARSRVKATERREASRAMDGRYACRSDVIRRVTTKEKSSASSAHSTRSKIGGVPSVSGGVCDDDDDDDDDDES